MPLLRKCASCEDEHPQLARKAQAPEAAGSRRTSGAASSSIQIGSPHDAAEQEADRVAERVMRMPAPIPAATNNDAAESTTLRRYSSTGQARTAPEIVDDVLRSAGEPLDREARAFAEPRFGHDFSRVRVHADAYAAESARRVDALAYTVGRHVVFGAGAYAPRTEHGRALLAHELAHVVQQGAAAPQSSRPIGSAAVASPVLQRQPTGDSQTHPVPMFGGPGSQIGAQLSRTEWTLQGFATDSDALTADHERLVRQIANELNNQPLAFGEYVTIWGGADSRGSDEHNRGLGQRRADRVRERIIALLRDPAAAQEIRAHSLGEMGNTRAGDMPEYRQVTVAITRRTWRTQLVPPLQVQPPPSQQPPISLRDFLQPPGVWPGVHPTAPTRPTLPPNFWTLPSPRPVSRDFINDLSRWITGELGREQIAHIGARIASELGMDRAEVQRKLDEALISGGEAALREALRALIQVVAGPPTTQPPNQYGPPVRELPLPPTLQTPPIPLPF